MQIRSFRRYRYLSLFLVLSMLCLACLSAWLGQGDVIQHSAQAVSSQVEEYRQEASLSGELQEPIRLENDTIQDVDQDPDRLASPLIVKEEQQTICANVVGSVKNKNKRNREILLWEEPEKFSRKHNWFPGVCLRPTLGPCTLTFDQSRSAKADAVVFNPVKIRDTKPPFPKPYGQVWVLHSLEPPNHWLPGVKAEGWRGVFNWTMTYRVQSDIFNPVNQLVRLDKAPRRDFRQIAARKTRSVAWFVSSCNTTGHYGTHREAYARELQKYIDVDIFGECGPHTCPKKDNKCVKMLTKTYRFYLAFENAMCRDYITEKFYRQFGGINLPVHVINVVLGGADYRKYFPPETFINVADFPTPKDLAQYLRALGEDLDRYSDLLEKASRFVLLTCRFSEPFCKLCDMLHEKNPTPKVYHNLDEYFDTGACFDAHWF